MERKIRFGREVGLEDISEGVLLLEIDELELFVVTLGELFCFAISSRFRVL